MDKEREEYISMLESASPFKKKVLEESLQDDLKNRESHTSLGKVVRNWDGKGKLPTNFKSKELDAIKNKILGKGDDESLEEEINDENLSPMEKLDEETESLDESDLEELDDPESEILKRLITEMENIASEIENEDDDECLECDDDDDDYLDDEYSSEDDNDEEDLDDDYDDEDVEDDI